MVKLGCFDTNVGDSTCQAYLKQVEQTTRLAPASVNPGLDKLTLQKYQPQGPGTLSVAGVQQGLKSIGFFPLGDVDGIYGYRTHSAVRLFQEYVRSMEKAEELLPNGQFTPATQAHLERWMKDKLSSQWTQTIQQFQAGQMGQTEHADWLDLLKQVKAQYLAAPSKMLQKVHAYLGPSSTRKVADWDFTSPQNVHLIGVRRTGLGGKFEDIFVLLINGMVFKFQGTTDPGTAGNANGFAFLVQGQHDYHFGWHKETYLALRPLSQVLVLRTKVDQLTDASLESPLEANSTINVHWGGPGMAKDVKNWSEGCQVINGTVYFNHAGNLIDCSKFAAIASTQPLTDATKTRGAYNVLVDLVTTLSSDPSALLRYVLLIEPDLELNPKLRDGLADSRNKIVALFH